MVHNIQIGVNVDDNSIIRGVEQAAISEIQKGLFGNPIGHNWSRYEFSREFRNQFLNDYMDKVFADEKLKATIAKETALVLADKLMHSNRFKEKLIDMISSYAEQIIGGKAGEVNK